MSRSKRKGTRKSKSSASRRNPTPPASSRQRKPGPGKKFPYGTIGGDCLRPLVSIGLIDVHGNELLPKPKAIVDSGADCTTLPKDWAAPLGIDCDTDCIKFKGGTAAGMADQYLFESGIETMFLGKKIRLGAIFSPGCGAALLGREDFFRHFSVVSFNQSAEEFTLESVQDWDSAKKAVDVALAKLAKAIKREAAKEAAAAGATS